MEFFKTLTPIHAILFQPQDQEGYNYEVPENPLVISRPTEAPADGPPPVEAVEAEEESQPDSQHGGGGGGHGHHDSDDPLDWLRASIPGKQRLDASKYLGVLK